MGAKSGYHRILDSIQSSCRYGNGLAANPDGHPSFTQAQNPRIRISRQADNNRQSTGGQCSLKGLDNFRGSRSGTGAQHRHQVDDFRPIPGISRIIVIRRFTAAAGKNVVNFG